MAYLLNYLKNINSCMPPKDKIFAIGIIACVRNAGKAISLELAGLLKM